MSRQAISLMPYQIKALEFIRERMICCGFYQSDMIADADHELLAGLEAAEEGADEPD